MVCDNDESSISQVTTKVFRPMVDRQTFSFCSVIVLFSRIQRSSCIMNCSFLSIDILSEDSSNGIQTGICMKFKRKIKAWVGKDWSSDEFFLKCFKSMLLLGMPFESRVSSERSKLVCSLSKVFDKSSIIRSQSKELSDFGNIGGRQSVFVDFNLGWIGFYSFIGDLVSQEYHGVATKGAFVWTKDKIIRDEPVENGLEIIQMLLKSFTENNDIIDIDHAAFPIEACEHHVHGSLKGCWGVCKSKRHD